MQSPKHIEKLGGDIEMNVHVLTTGYWPAFPAVQVKLPAQLAHYQVIKLLSILSLSHHCLDTYVGTHYLCCATHTRTHTYYWSQQEIFRSFYLSKYSGRRLFWQSTLGNAVMKAHYPKATLIPLIHTPFNQTACATKYLYSFHNQFLMDHFFF